jgi:toxin ParE1/3/4
MSFEIRLHPEAAIDIQEGIDYYKVISNELGKKFLSQINNSLEELKQFPFYEVRYDNVRMRKVKVFPYLIHFVIDEEKNIIKIYGVRLALRDPKASWFFKEESETYELIEKTEI